MTHDEAVLEARKKFANGDFKRRILKRRPKNIVLDWTELECGHTSFKSADMHDEFDSACSECVEQWIKENTTS